MPATIFSGSDIKTLKDNLSLNDKAKILPVSGSPASGGGVAAPIGSLVLDYTNGKTYKKIGALDTDWSELGSGIGGINYVTNTDAEAGTTGWSTYADAAGAQPVDGTGGSPNVTWTRSTTTPLRGTADFNFAKDAANRQGEGVATDITINLADQAKVLTVSFDYEILSGTYATGDLTVYLIQDPAGTPVVIQPAGYQVQSATAGTKMRQIATFQTASTGQSYRICFHVASTSASAYTLAIDNVICGPQVVQYGAPVTDWQSYTPTVTGITIGNGTLLGLWRRVGDSIEVKNHFIAGTTSASTGQWSFSLPSGLSFAGPIDSISDVCAGTATWLDSGLARFLGGVKPGGTNTVSIASLQGGATKYDDAGSGGPAFTNGDTLSFIYTARITGWSSTVQMSNDTDTRVVAAAAENLVSATYSTTAPLDFSTIKFDTHSAVTTGASWKFTAPVPGYYRVSVAGTYTTVATGGALQVYKNGVQYSSLANYPSVAGYRISGSETLYLVAGDYIDIRPGGSQVTYPGYVSVERLSGPSAIAASETVAARYEATGNRTPTSSKSVNYDTKVYDTHGAVTTVVGDIAGWKFTAPMAGKYSVNVSTYSSTGVGGSLYVGKNGSTLAAFLASTNVSNILQNGVATVDVIAGDTLDVRADATPTLNNVTAKVLSVTIVRVGN